MSGGIFIIQSDGKLLELNETAYDSESVLQQQLATYPNLLAGSQIDSDNPRRWLLISREMSIPLGEDAGGWMAVDHLFLDQDAIPTLVEVKRSSDVRIRREVVGQMLDYAANAIVYWPPETIRARFEANCQANGEDPEQLLIGFLEEGTDLEQFWQQVEDNLRVGKVRMLFVADIIPPELQRVVEFLNEQMDPAEVLAVEIKQYANQAIQTLVPRVIGQTAKSKQKKEPRAKRKWDEESFFQELEDRQGNEAAMVARRILEWAEPKVTRIYWGEGIRSGSFVPILNHKDTDHQLFAIYTYGALEIYFQYYQYKKPFGEESKRRELLARLNEIEDIDIPADAIARRPSIGLKLLSPEEKLRGFLETYEWFLGEVKAT
jgi:hypothetical protein